MTIYNGTAGDDSILGSGSADDFHMELGGVDTVSGGDGDDVFYFGGTFSGADQVTGGAGADYLVLDGDYSAGVAFTPTSMVGVETIIVKAGHDYVLTGLTDANVISGFVNRLTIDGSQLLADDGLEVDARQLSQFASLSVTGGAGNDTVIGGQSGDIIHVGEGDNVVHGGKRSNDISAGDGDNSLFGGKGSDRFIVGAGTNRIITGDGGDAVYMAVFNEASTIQGGSGTDRLFITAPAGQSVVLGPDNLKDFDILSIDGSMSIVANKGLVGESGSMEVGEGGDGSLSFNGRAEKHGAFFIHGAGGDDTLTGGAGADTIFAGSGADRITGGKGADTLAGSEETTFVYAKVGESSAAASDTIQNLFDADTIDLRRIDADTGQAGNQAFHLVGAFSGHAGELLLSYDSIRNVTSLQGDVDGDGQADLQISLSGDHTGFTGFAL